VGEMIGDHNLWEWDVYIEFLNDRAVILLYRPVDHSKSGFGPGKSEKLEQRMRKHITSPPNNRFLIVCP
jgi:hypothetical protein